MTPALTSALEARLEDRALWLRRTVLEMAVRAKSGHITTAFSQAEILCVLYYGGWLRVDPKDAKWPERDRFILSKGQGGLGLYPVLADLGFFSRRELDDFAGRGKILGVHAEWNIPGVVIISGSLGHGLPIATGIATALKRDGNPAKVVVLLGDAELYEGSNWEAALYAAHAGLDNIVCVVDCNGLGTIGYTDERARGDNAEKTDGPDLGSVADRFSAFGFTPRIISDGHDFGALWAGFEWAWTTRSSQPRVVVARTKKGKGCRVFEDKKGWHYRVPSGADLVSARCDLGLPENGFPGPVSELTSGATP